MDFQGKKLIKEQIFSCKCMKSGEDTKIQAPAGSGKTFVLQAGADSMKGSGLYISFNKAIADEAKTKFPASVECRTGHSLAFGAEGWKYKDRFSKITGSLLANSIDLGDPGIFPTITTKGYIILDTLRNFCYSDMSKITTRHIPKLKIIEDIGLLEQTKKDIVKHTKNVWDLMVDEKSTFPITHDFYLKLWALNNPKIKKDFIFFDEAQDANPVMLDIVYRQNSQKYLWVIDSNKYTVGVEPQMPCKQ